MNNCLGLIGLCFKAGRLAVGDDATSDYVKAGHARVILLTKDAGANIVKKANYHSSDMGVAVMTLPITKEELGYALGKKACAICCISDSGFASSIASKIKDLSPDNQEAALMLSKKNDKIMRRRTMPRKDRGQDTGFVEYIDIEEGEYNRKYAPQTTKKKTKKNLSNKKSTDQKPYAKSDDSKSYKKFDDKKQFKKTDGNRPYKKSDNNKPYKKLDDNKQFKKADDNKPYKKFDDKKSTRTSDNRKTYGGKANKPYSKSVTYKKSNRKGGGDR